MADDNSNSTQSNIDDLVKELSRPQGVPPKTSDTVPPKAAPSVPPRPASPVPPPTSAKPPVMPPKPPLASGPKEYDSSIRTMSDDLSHLKSGQKPQGIDVPRTVPKPVPPPPAKPATPPSVPAKPPVMSMPKPVTPAPMPKSFTPEPPKKPAAPSMPPVPKMPTNPGSSPVPKPPVMPPKPVVPVPAGKAPAPAPAPDSKGQFYVPENTNNGGGANRNVIFIGIAVLAVILAVVYWFFFIRQPSAPAPTPTPVASATPTATPVTLPGAFSNKIGTIVLPASGNPFTAFKQAWNAQVMASSSLGTVEIDNTTASGSMPITDITGLLDRFLINYPAGLKTGLTGQAVFLDFDQVMPDGTTSPRIAMVQEVSDVQTVSTALSQWSGMVSDLQTLFGYSKTNHQLVSDTYNGVPFQYVEAPDSNSGLAYAIVNNKYLVLASSRESFRAVVDKLLTLQ